MNFFMHIPKTAGTSFRVSAEQYFGRSRVVYDYGSASPVTSQLVQDFLFKVQPADKAGFYHACDQQEVALLAGHKALGRFVGGVGLGKIVTFVREPLERAYSEYLHFCREKGFEGEFRDFFLQQRENHQHQMFSGLSPRSVGFVGITERYDDSLRLLNAHFGWRIRKRRVNRSGLFGSRPGRISQADRQAFYHRNPKDVALYQDACWMFEQRLRLFKQGQPFVHAQLERVGNGKISGWAFWADKREAPVILDLLHNGAKVQQLVADQKHPLLARHGAPQAGHVAFGAALALKPGDEVQLVVSATGQPIEPQPIPVQ